MLSSLRSNLVRFGFSAQMAGHGVFSNILRSVLTVLGVTIGVAAVISLMGIGEGARQAVVNQFKSLGTNVIVIQSQDPLIEFQPELTDELLERVEVLSAATPVIYTEGVLGWRRDRAQGDILGVNGSFPAIRDHRLLSGHFFTRLHVEQRSPVVVLGYNVAVGLMGGRSPVGQTLTIDGKSFRIIGVLEPKGASQAENIDDKVIVPYTIAFQIAEKRTVGEIWAKAETSQNVDLALVQLSRIIGRNVGQIQQAPSSEPGYNGDYYYEMGGMRVEEYGYSAAGSSVTKNKELVTITSLNQLVKEADKANRVMTLLLGGIAAVSLLVGGLGIMNIMLVAVTERTKEIGVRRALGAKQSDLLVQFLLEAFYLSGLGVIFGIVVGIWGISIFAQYGFETAVSFDAIKIATGVALASGLLFGVYPAISASSVPPIEALRR